MARFSPKYSDGQRDALIAAVLDDGIKLPKAIKLASQGELGNLEPWTIPYSSAHGLVTQERKRRRDSRSPDEMSDELYTRLWRMVDQGVRRIEAKVELTPKDVNDLRGYARAANEIGKRQRPQDAPTPQPPRIPAPSIVQRLAPQSSFIDDLAEKATARAAEAHDQLAEAPIRPHEDPSPPNTSPTVTDAQRKAAQALLTAGNGLAAPTR